MKNKILISIFMLSFLTYAQENWEVGSDFWSGKALFVKGSKISIDQAIDQAKGQESIINKLKAAKSNRTIGAVLAYPGAFAFGYTLGLSLNSNDQVKPNWAIGGIGGAMMIGGAILQGSGNKKLKEAAEEFNALNKTSSNFDPEISIYSSSNGIGLKMTF